MLCLTHPTSSPPFVFFALFTPPLFSAHLPSPPSWRPFIPSGHPEPLKSLSSMPMPHRAGYDTTCYRALKFRSLCYMWTSGESRPLGCNRLLQKLVPVGPGQSPIRLDLHGPPLSPILLVPLSEPPSPVVPSRFTQPFPPTSSQDSSSNDLGGPIRTRILPLTTFSPESDGAWLGSLEDPSRAPRALWAR